MDEMDILYEIGLADSENYWVTQETFKSVILDLNENYNPLELITFETMYGMEVHAFRQNFRTLNFSSRAQRDEMRRLNKVYKEQELEKKEEWE